VAKSAVNYRLLRSAAILDDELLALYFWQLAGSRNFIDELIDGILRHNTEWRCVNVGDWTAAFGRSAKVLQQDGEDKVCTAVRSGSGLQIS
jgi:hypothetical protein